MVKHQILSANSYEFSPAVLKIFAKEFNFQNRQFCDANKDCYSYIFAPKMANAKKINSTYRADFTGTPHESKLLVLRDDVPELKGNVLILIHGFKISKEWMATTSAYFQFFRLQRFFSRLARTW